MADAIKSGMMHVDLGGMKRLKSVGEEGDEQYVSTRLVQSAGTFGGVCVPRRSLFTTMPLLPRHGSDSDRR